VSRNVYVLVCTMGVVNESDTFGRPPRSPGESEVRPAGQTMDVSDSYEVVGRHPFQTLSSTCESAWTRRQVSTRRTTVNCECRGAPAVRVAAAGAPCTAVVTAHRRRRVWHSYVRHMSPSPSVCRHSSRWSVRLRRANGAGLTMELAARCARTHRRHPGEAHERAEHPTSRDTGSPTRQPHVHAGTSWRKKSLRRCNLSHRCGSLVVESATCRSCPVLVVVSPFLVARELRCASKTCGRRRRDRSEGTQTRDKRAYTRYTVHGTRMGTDETHDAMECFVSPVVVAGNLSPLGMVSVATTPHNARARCALCLVSTTRLCVAQHTRVFARARAPVAVTQKGEVAVVPRKQPWLAALGRVCPSGSVLTHHACLSHDGRV
jgi:hypothetical protein